MINKILLVDNNQVLLRLMENHFQQQGYEVKTAQDGLQALQVLDDFLADLIFVDLIMPKISGEKLCAIVRSLPRFRQTPMVIVSAIAAEDNIDFLSMGASACIAKGPFKRMAEHMDSVTSLLEQKAYAEVGQKIYGADNIHERQITRELLAARKHFEVTIGHMADGFLELTAEGRVVYVNQVATELFGEAEECLLSSHLVDLFPRELQDLITLSLANAQDGAVEIGEEVDIVLQGTYLLIKFVPFRDQGLDSFIVLLHDISRRKVAERKLLEQQEMLQEKVKVLSGMLPICSACKKIRDDQGYWEQIEEYISDHSEAQFTHSICPECAEKLYGDIL